jgi:hypothetical protein
MSCSLLKTAWEVVLAPRKTYSDSFLHSSLTEKAQHSIIPGMKEGQEANLFAHVFIFPSSHFVFASEFIISLRIVAFKKQNLQRVSFFSS